MREPQEIADNPAEQAVARVAAVDVAKDSGVVCTRVPREGDGPGPLAVNHASVLRWRRSRMLTVGRCRCLSPMLSANPSAASA